VWVGLAFVTGLLTRVSVLCDNESAMYKGEFTNGNQKENNQDSCSLIDHWQIHQAQYGKAASKDIHQAEG
jgi:hypothetical protein